MTHQDGSDSLIPRMLLFCMVEAHGPPQCSPQHRPLRCLGLLPLSGALSSLEVTFAALERRQQSNGGCLVSAENHNRLNIHGGGESCSVLEQIALRSVAPPPASRTRSERHSESRARSRGAASQ
ncbi:unnamed protein product [Pleuronectes platessa]|uniref:Uncharacterized protein n=1 Tax=Pleuronectes platessa TaxID=8262 RepID=A0A9N7W1K0_PLEPL|nr:unnamed protein product [Pleuronectes platessa]